MPIEFPAVVGFERKLAVVKQDFFERVGDLRLAENRLELNVTASGVAGAQWILDGGAQFFELRAVGFAPASLLQRLGLKRRREVFEILPVRSIRAGELSARLGSCVDDNADFSNVAELRNHLSRLAADQVIDKSFMNKYLGV
jgi:hypothetical protein